MREIRYRQPRLDIKGKFIDWFYWGFINGGFISPLRQDLPNYQYTGLHDKNGQEIYEGDIRGYQGDPSRYVIIYADGAWRKKYPEWDIPYSYPILNQWEINRSIHLGTIYENPELVQP